MNDQSSARKDAPDDQLEEKEDTSTVLKRPPPMDIPAISSVLYHSEAAMTPGSVAADSLDEYEMKPSLTLSPTPTPSSSNSLKRKPPIEQVDTRPTAVKPAKKSRKLQGAGVKKPLYTRYESIFIIKAFKTITDKIPSLVLIDLFKIIAILFNEEANRQGFKERTSDQLYQKYKRIQHGLNHGEVEFTDFFERNKYNPKEWIPSFGKVEKTDEILKYIKFQKLDEAIKEILGSSVANLKPPLPDPQPLQQQQEGEEEGEEGQDEEQEGVYDSQTAQEKMREFTQEPESQSTATAASSRARFDDLRSPKSAATEEDLLRLAGDVSLTEPSISAAAEALTSLDPSNAKQKHYHSHNRLQEPPALSTTIDPQPASDASSQVVVQDLRSKLHHAHQEIHRQKDVIRLLEQNAILKNQECQFLKTMIKEDLSYIRHKLNENSNIVSNYHSSSGIANSLSRYHHPIAAVEPSNETTQLPAIDESRVPAPRLPHTFFSQNYSPSVANIRGMGNDNGVSSARMVIAASTSVLDNNNNHGNAWDNKRSGIDSGVGVSYQHRHSTDHAGLEPLVYNNVENAPAGQVNNIDKQTTG